MPTPKPKPGPRSAAQFECPVEGFLALVGGKYRIRILWELKAGPLRYGELRTALAASMGNKTIAARVLSRDLKELTARSMIRREDRGTMPLHVEYALTDVGETFIPVLATIHEWGVKHLVKQSVLDALAKRRDRQSKTKREIR